MILPYVYKLIDYETGQFYIGYRFKNVELKLKAEDDIGHGYFTSSNYITKKNFYRFAVIIIAEFFSKEAAYWAEQQLIKENKSNPLILNRHYQDPETKAKAFVNYAHSDETKKKMTGLKRTQKFKESRRDAMLGNIPWNAGATKDTNNIVAIIANKRKEHGNPHLIGTKHSKERVEKVRAALIGYQHTEQTKQNMSAARKGRTWEDIYGDNSASLRRKTQKERMTGAAHPGAKKVKTPSGIFDSVRLAANHFGVCDATIRSRCLNEKFNQWYYLKKAID